MLLICSHTHFISSFFFFNDTATTEIYTLSLHDALPISSALALVAASGLVSARFAQQRALCSGVAGRLEAVWDEPTRDRKSTRLNSSHLVISYAVFCLKKKKGQRRCECGSTPIPRLELHP